MWKSVIRGIRETVERRICRTNVYSQSSQDNTNNEVKTNLMCQQKILAPIFFCNKGFCGWNTNTYTKGKEHNFKWNTKHTWTEAFSWSGVLTAGWMVYQSLSLRKRIFQEENKKNNKLFDCVGVSHILKELLSLQLKCILPVTNCIGSHDKNHDPQNQNSDSQWNAKEQSDVITDEKAFKKAADEFTNIHKVVVGELELRYGIKAIDEKRYKDAWMHFSQGAEMLSPRSMFNLGLCYELGIGTSPDQEKAAKYYNNAAAYNHADALYNLGVFHAQGRGGLPIDIDAARIYFTRAAKLGQVQAQHALNLENIKSQSKENKSIPTTSKDNRFETYKMSNTRNKLIEYDTLNTKSTCNMSEYNKEIIEDPTQIFLNFLGLKESSQMPIMTPNDPIMTPIMTP